MQNQVYINNPVFRVGQVTRGNPAIKLPRIVEGSDVKIGSFVFEGTEKGQQVTGKDASATSVAGLILFERYQVAKNGFDDSHKLEIIEGSEVATYQTGFGAVISSTASTYRQKVGVNPTTGEIETFDATPSTGFIDTGWLVETPAGANEPCEIFKI
ncbi:MAG: hypothetical protein ACK5N8_06800 [Alphaproteobacteria bacterium]